MSPRSLSSNFEKVSDRPSPESKHGVNGGPKNPVQDDVELKSENINDLKMSSIIDNLKIDDKKDENASISVLADLDSDEEDGWS
jgi:hypothetical protein